MYDFAIVIVYQEPNVGVKVIICTVPGAEIKK